MKQIPLTEGAFALVDDEYFGELSQYKWQLGTGGYALRTEPAAFGVRVKAYMQDVITGYKKTDHRGGNKLNNQRSNLRLINGSGNRINSLKQRRSNSTSKYRGVFRDKGKWRARVTLNEGNNPNRQKHLGTFDNEESAAHAADAHNREEWGDLATYNFPRPGERSALTGQIENLS